MNTISTVLAKWFYIHGLEVMLIIGISFTAIGFLLGYFLWRHYKFHIRRIQDTNTKLRDKISILEEQQQTLTSHLKSHSHTSESSDTPT